jgi:hypothetical protein
MPLLQIQTQAGVPIQAGNLRLTPFARSVTLRFPNFPGGFIWNRPTALLVQSADGNEELLPIHDLTRRRQFALLGLGLAAGLIIRMLSRK